MTGLRVLIARLKGLFAKESQDRELHDELQTHLELLVEEKRRQGMTEQEARRAAQCPFWRHYPDGRGLSRAPRSALY